MLAVFMEETKHVERPSAVIEEMGGGDERDIIVGSKNEHVSMWAFENLD